MNIKIAARLTGLAMAIGLFAGVVNVSAQSGAKGGATRLLQLSGTPVTSKSEPGDYKLMSCGRCVNEVFQVRDTDSKGGARALLAGGPLTKTVSRHGCKSCGTEWTVFGHGKAKVSVASHKCTSCGEASLACCSTSKSGPITTKGMDKKFEVAPLK